MGLTQAMKGWYPALRVALKTRRSGPVEHGVALADALEHLEGADEAGRDDPRVAGPELAGVARRVDDAQTPAGTWKNSWRPSWKAIRQAPGSHSQSPIDRAPPRRVAFGGAAAAARRSPG
jgi:hypothetical protein